jgi:hypothetical protein
LHECLQSPIKHVCVSSASGVIFADVCSSCAQKRVRNRNEALSREPATIHVLLAPPGSSWFLLVPPGPSWILLAPPSSSWLLLAPPGLPTTGGVGTWSTRSPNRLPEPLAVPSCGCGYLPVPAHQRLLNQRWRLHAGSTPVVAHAPCMATHPELHSGHRTHGTRLVFMLLLALRRRTRLQSLMGYRSNLLLCRSS